MSADLERDLDIFFDPDDFGVEAIYEPASGGPDVKLSGIYDEEHRTFDPNRWMGGPEYAQQQGAVISGGGPMFRCRQTLLPDGGNQDSRLIVKGRRFRVYDVQPDGTGVVVLVLMEEL